MKHLEHLLGQGVGIHEILISPLQALGVISPIQGVRLLQIIMEALQDMQAVDFHYFKVESDLEVVQEILG